MFENTVYVTKMMAIDPDTKLLVEIEIRNPYNDGFLHIGDDE